MTYPVNVVVCGMVRSDLESHLIFRDIIAARNAGTIKRAVFVDWQEDFDRRQKGLKSYLLSLGVDVLALPPPPQGMTSNNIQISQLYHALSLFNDDDLVLRTRTDKAYPLLHAFLKKTDFFARRCRDAPEATVQRGKFLVSGVNVTRPFCHVDFQIMGLVEDFRRVLNLDGYFDVFCKQAKEAQWFALPFIHSYPDMRALFENFDLNEIVGSMRSWSKTEAMPMPEPLIRTMAHYYDLCRRHYALMDDRPLPQSATLSDAIDARNETGWDWGSSTFVYSSDWLERFKTGRNCAPFTDCMRQFAAEDSKPMLSQGDIKSIREFFAVMLGKKGSEMWPGSAFGGGNLAQAEKSALAPSFEEMAQKIILQILPNFDMKLVDKALHIIAPAFDDYPSDAYYEFGPFLERLGDIVCNELANEHQNNAPRDALALPALFYTAALAFNSSYNGAAWLAQALLEGKLPNYFAETTRWGISARFHKQPPYVVFLMGVMMLKGIGGPADRQEGMRLISQAAESGDENAKAFLKGLGGKQG